MRRLAACLLLAACSSFDGSSPTDPLPEGGVDGGTDGDIGPGAVCDGKIIYVSTSVAVEGDGCSIAQPRKTITSAIQKVKDLKVADFEIHVCAGNYTESVVLDVPTTLRGGYDCTKFERALSFGTLTIDPASGGSTLDPTNATRIIAPTSAVSLVVNGTVPPSVQIDGLVVDAPTGATFDLLSPIGSIGARFSNGANPTVMNCAFNANDGTAANQISSVAVHIDHAAPTFVKDRFDARGATSLSQAAEPGKEALGSAAIFADTSTVSVDGSAFQLGNGTSAVRGTVGISAVASTGLTVTNSSFLRTGGRAGVVTAEGIDVVTDDVAVPIVIRNNRLHVGGAPTCAGTNTPCYTIGFTTGGGTATIEDNIVDVGEDVQVNGSTYGTVGIVVRDSSNGSIANNVVAGGQFTGDHASVGIVVQRTKPMSTIQNILIAHNTVLATQDITFHGGDIGGIVVADNLLFASPLPSSASAFRIGMLADCFGSPQQPCTQSISTRANAFVAFPILAADSTKSAAVTPPAQPVSINATTVAAVESMYGGTDDVRLAVDCGTDSTATCGMVPPTCNVSCAQTVLQGSTRATLFAPGFHLLDNAPCLVGKGASPLPANDLEGVARSTTNIAKGAYLGPAKCQ